ncbi:MAG: YceI family protein [Acidobacteriota bacterium]
MRVFLFLGLSIVSLGFGISRVFTAAPSEPSVAANSGPAAVHYRLDASKSKFMVFANRTGLAYFKGKSHQIAVRDFEGEASMDPSAINPASLEMTIKSASLEETRDVYTPEQKGIINKELNEIVLETAKYPEITFKSTDVKGRLKNGAFELKIGGDITLHGVTKHIVIPTTVTIEGDTMHAKGEFKLNRKNFKVNATEAFHGFVKVKHVLIFSFDIVAARA